MQVQAPKMTVPTPSEGGLPAEQNRPRITQPMFSSNPPTLVLDDADLIEVMPAAGPARPSDSPEPTIVPSILSRLKGRSLGSKKAFAWTGVVVGLLGLALFCRPWALAASTSVIALENSDVMAATISAQPSAKSKEHSARKVRAAKTTAAKAHARAKPVHAKSSKPSPAVAADLRPTKTATRSSQVESTPEPSTQSLRASATQPPKPSTQTAQPEPASEPSPDDPSSTASASVGAQTDPSAEP